MPTPTASEILQQCERDLQGILQRCVKIGDYAAVQDLARWAGQVADLASEAATPSHIRSSSTPATIRQSLADRSTDADAEGTLKGEPTKSTRRSKKTPYPQFGRRGDQLIKTGWSRREKKEYKHKSPKYVADLLRVALVGAGRNGKVVPTDDLFPLKEQDGGEVPSYQAYLCLAWLRHEGLVTQEGRSGYRVPNLTSLSEAIEKRWASLPQL